MNILTILIAVLAAAAAIFATLFFQDRKEAKKYEAKSYILYQELSDLKCEMARRDALAGDIAVPLSRESIADFLRKEKTADVTVSEEGNLVLFKLGDDNYHVDCNRLPQQIILRKGYNVEGADFHWDVLERASQKVTSDLIMVKMSVEANDSYDYLIVSPDHTIASFKENFDLYMSIISDAERLARDEYWRIMEIEHPDECGPEDQDDAETTTQEDVAMKLAQASSDHAKIKS